MKRFFILAVISSLAITACGRTEEASDSGSGSARGRYAGVGVFDAGRLWSKMIVPTTQQDDSSARLSDDEHVIVVVDSQTGEVRQCGDHSGYCIGVSPWGTKDGATPLLPAKLSAHSEDLDAAEMEANTEKR